MNLWLTIFWMAVFVEKIVENISNTQRRWNVKHFLSWCPEYRHHPDRLRRPALVRQLNTGYLVSSWTEVCSRQQHVGGDSGVRLQPPTPKTADQAVRTAPTSHNRLACYFLFLLCASSSLWL